jgi:hypothetical protein
LQERFHSTLRAIAFAPESAKENGKKFTLIPGPAANTGTEMPVLYKYRLEVDWYFPEV